MQEKLDLQAKRILFFRTGFFYEHGNKNSKFQATALREICSTNTITQIKTRENKLIHATDQIAAEFHGFYTKLYNLPPSHKPAAVEGHRSQIIAQYLTQSGLPSVAEVDAMEIDRPIELMELLQAIKSLKSGKSPGPDGFTAIYYKTFSHLLAKPILQALNSLSTPQNLPPTFNTAHITVLPKPGKDPNICSSYRPISLLNLDMKLLSKIIATRIGKFLPDIVGPDQAGFMPEREAPDNVVKVMNFIHSLRGNSVGGLILSTDAEEAFDRVVWDYMFAVCKHVGFQTNMLTWISTLYQNQTARLKIKGSLSEPVQIHNGMRQGCPLSPILFILTLEPCIHTINGNLSVKGLSLGHTCHKIAAYADDLLFIVTQPHTSIPNLLKDFEMFGYISNLKINFEKSEALNISLNPKQLGDTKSNCPFKWVISDSST